MAEQIIDFHVHPFRQKQHCLNFYPEMPDLDAPGMRSQLQKAGITQICGSVLQKVPDVRDFSTLRALNREALELQNQLGDFYTPGFHIHPGFVQESCEEIDFMHRRNVHLIGELVPYMHGWGDFPAENWMEIMDTAKGRGFVCSYHTPFAFDMNAMIAQHPDITFVAAHPGDHDRVPEHIALMKKYDNVYLDLSGTGLFRFGLLKHLVSAVGAERILFGTDYPICNPRMYVQAVYGEDISDGDREKILFKNARRLLKIGQIEG